VTNAEWLDIAAHIADLWPHQPLPPGTITAWYPLLAHMDAQHVRQAVDALAVAGERFPPGSVGQIIKAAEPPRLTPTEIFHEAKDLAGRRGLRNPPDLADLRPELAAFVSVFSWERLCMGPDHRLDLPANAYEHRDAMAAVDAALAKLEGRDAIALDAGRYATG
jgi:hypothetical protein